MKIVLISNTSPGLPVSEYATHLIAEVAKTDNELFVIGNTCSKHKLSGSTKLIKAWTYNSLLAWLQILLATIRVKPNAVWYNITLGTFGNGFANLFGLLTPMIFKILGFRVTITLHNLIDSVDLEKANLKGGLVTVWGAKIATLILAHSGTICVLLPEYESILRNNYHAKNVHVVPHGTLGKIPDTPQQNQRKQKKLNLMAFGIFGTHKPLEPLLEAMKILEKDSELFLTIAGGSNAHNPGYIEKMQEKYDLESVRFLGYIPEECVQETFQDADVVVLTNIENSGKSGALVQAGMYGKPVIAGDLDLFCKEEETGYSIAFCNPIDPQSIAAAILSLKNETAEQLATRGLSNYVAATRSPMSKVVETYLNLLCRSNTKGKTPWAQKNALRLAVVLIAAINVGLLFRPFLSLNWDSEMHLFFASHYLTNWFNPVDYRWYGGMYIFTSAPLVQQLIAIIGKVTSLETGYLIIQAIALIGLPLSVWCLAKEHLQETEGYTAELAALLSVGVSGTYVLLYTFGQLPAFAAIVFCLFACASLNRYLHTGKLLALECWFFLSGAAIASNHHTSIVMLSIMATGFVFSDWLKGQFTREQIKRAILAAIALVAVALIAVLPFWWWYLTQSLPQADILHPTREAFLSIPEYAQMFFWDIYGGILFLAPFMLLTVRKRQLWPLLGIIGFLFILGLGGNTPIPRLILGPMWGVLTYERFPYLAAILATIPIAMGMQLVAKIIPSRNIQNLIAFSVVLLLVLGLDKAISFPNQQDLLQKPAQTWEETEVVKFLNEHSAWKFITIGAGEPELARLTILSNAETVDGFYNPARTNPMLRASGQGTIDSEAWGMYAQDYSVLFNILQQPQQWGVRWVLSFTPWAEQHLRNSGWTLLHPIGSQIGWQVGDRSYSTITIWEAPKDKVAEMKTSAELDAIRQKQLPSGVVINILTVWWGVIPITLLLVGLALFSLEFRLLLREI